MTPTEILDKIVMRRLPRSSQAIVKIMGWSAAINFLARLNEHAHYIPKSPGNQKVLRGLAPDIKQKICDEMGGELWQPPSYRTLLIAERNAAIVADYQAGRTLSHLTIKYNISKQLARWIVKNFII